MKINANLNTLKASLKSHLERTKKNQQRDRKVSVSLSVYTAASSSLIAGLIGASKFLPTLENSFQIAALFLGVVQAAISAYGGLMRHQKLWMVAASVRHELLEIAEDLAHEEELGDLSQQKVNEFYERYKSVLDKEHELWSAARSS